MYKLLALRHTGVGIYTPYTKLEFVTYHNCNSDQCDSFFHFLSFTKHTIK